MSSTRWSRNRGAALPPDICAFGEVDPPLTTPLPDHRSLAIQGLGRGVGRPLGVGTDLGVGVGLGVGVAVGVGVGVTVGVLVGVGVALGDAVGVGVGVGCCPPGNTRT